MTFHLLGWVEQEGKKLSIEEVETIVRGSPREISMFGGEFFLTGYGFCARDALGIIPGKVPPGTIYYHGKQIGCVDPPITWMDLEKAITESVRLRCDQGLVALSGGVDSSLIAALAGLPCLAVGLEGSHDLERAEHASILLGLDFERVVIRDDEVEDALREVLQAIPEISPVDASIATTLYFLTREAGRQGYERVLSGQGADELFGGYARYLYTADPDDQRKRDIAGLRAQGDRDQAVASLHGVYLSLPYLDLRVVRAALSIPSDQLVVLGTRKQPLRQVAERHLPPDLAHAEKKAMQYGSGISNEIRRLARKRGFRNLRDYLGTLSGES